MCSASSSTRRILRITVPCLSGIEEPLTLRSLITVTVSPACSTLPLLSRTTVVFAAASPALHSKPQSAQIDSAPSR